MKTRKVDNKGFFGEGYYEATIKRFEPFKTKFGKKLMIWLEICNEYEKKMAINDFLNDFVTADNMLGKIYKICLNGTTNIEYDTDNLLEKKIGIVLRKKIRKGRSYLNVVNYMPLKQQDLFSSSQTNSSTAELAHQLATILESNPALAQQVQKLYKQQHQKSRTTNKNAPKSLKDVLKERSDQT